MTYSASTALLMVIIFATLAQWYVLAVLGALYYLYKNTGIGLIVAAILIDGYYFAFYEIPWISIGTFLVTLVSYTLKPRLLYTTQHEVVS